MTTNLFNSGTVGCLWYIAWVLIVREGPEKDKCVSKDELRYIQDSLGSKQHTRIKHPWKDIFTSKAVYAISASHFAENWGFYTMLTQLPTFLAGILLFGWTVSIGHTIRKITDHMFHLHYHRYFGL